MTGRVAQDVRRVSPRCRLATGVFITLWALMLWGVPGALAEPLSPSSPLYSPSAPLLDENPDVTADYKGTITEIVEEPPLPGALAGRQTKATLEWDESVSGPVDQIEYTGIYGPSSIHWHVNTLTGSVEDHSTDSAGNASECKGAFSPTVADGGEQGVYLPLDEPGHPAGGGNPLTNPDYSVRPPRGLPVSIASSSAPAGGDPNCETAYWNGTGSSTWGFPVAFASSDPAVQAGWGETVFPTVYFPPSGSQTQALPFSYTCAPPSCGPESTSNGGKTTYYGKVSVAVDSSITFSSPGLPAGVTPITQKNPVTPPEGTPFRPIACGPSSKPTCQDKKFAQEDLRNQLRPMALECGIATLGVSLVVAGVIAPETGAGSVVAVAGPAGAMLVAGSGTACGLLIKRAYDDSKIIEDPPIGGLKKLARPVKVKGPAARLPSCGRYHGRLKSFCASLRSEELRYLAGIRESQSIDAALLTTVDRVTGAYNAHDHSALTAQERHAVSLRAQLLAASTREQVAGTAISRLIKSRHMRVSLSASQTQQGITRAFSKLVKLGLQGPHVEQLAGVTLTAEPMDVLVELQQSH